jgi:hypothetical protein
MIYVVSINDHMHHLLNEPKMWIFAYNSDRMVYTTRGLKDVRAITW